VSSGVDTSGDSSTAGTGNRGDGSPDGKDIMSDTAPLAGIERGFRKTRDGIVVSDKMDKTVVVAVEDRVKHAVYSKIIRRTNKLKAHDEQNSCGVGDRVLLMETRPLSATKRWRVVEILEKAE